MSINIRNRLPGTIERIVSDKVVSEVVIRTAAGTVTSIITTSSVKRDLKEGERFRGDEGHGCVSREGIAAQFGDNSAAIRQASSVKTVESPNL
jgi:molybdopterin-binding protein